MEEKSKHQIIYEMLQTLDIPVAYDHFDSDKNISPPFIVYRETSIDTFKADDSTYFREYNFEIELVTEIKNPTLQNNLENLLTNNKIPFDLRNELWDKDEKIYHNIYDI